MLELDMRDVALGAPFAHIRSFILQADALLNTQWSTHYLTRAAFHRSGTSEESLSEQQQVATQLRFYTTQRVMRGLRLVMRDIAQKLTDDLRVRLSSLPAEPDATLLNLLGSETHDAVFLTVDLKRAPHAAAVLSMDQETTRFLRMKSAIKDGSAGERSVERYVAELLSYGDSWSARGIAQTWLDWRSSFASSSGDTFGLAFALQDETGTAEKLFELWGTESRLDEARSRYSISMLYARHHPAAFRDHEKAKRELEAAWDLLVDEKDSEQVAYERVFNRNGYALLLFRDREFEKAAMLLENGIAFIQASRFDSLVHHTVLTSNLGRVYAAMGNGKEAERCLREAVAMDPLFAEYIQDLASFLCDRGELVEAESLASRASAADPSIPKAARLHGYILMQRGDFDAARQRYLDALRLGDQHALTEAIKAAASGRAWDWIAEFDLSTYEAHIDASDLAELLLLKLEARVERGDEVDSRVELEGLRARFPDDELIESNWIENFAS